MSWFESETWKAFFPNFLAVVAGIVLTFGTDRFVENCRQRQEIRAAIAALDADARESVGDYRAAAGYCRSMGATIDSIVRSDGRYDELPPQTLQRFLWILLEKDGFAEASSARDMLRQSGVLRYMSPELLSLVDDLRISESRMDDAVRSCMEDMEKIRTGLSLDSRKFPPSMRGYDGGADAVRFVMEYPPAYNYALRCPLSELAEMIDDECSEVEKTLERIEAVGH